MATQKPISPGKKSMPPSQPKPVEDYAGALGEEFIRLSRRQLRERLSRIETCTAKLSVDQIWSREHETENAIGNLILHLAGNVRQWIICGVGGASGQRDRDTEFSRREPVAVEELLAHLRETIDEADAVLARVSKGELLERRRIQVYDVTVIEAIYHVVEHFAEHTGQIIWATKRMSGEDLGFYRYLSTKQSPPGGLTP